MKHLEDAEWLRQQGHRVTLQRLQVLQAIKAHGHHVTAEELHAAIVPDQPYLDITTVYRTLQWLQRVGFVAPLAWARASCTTNIVGRASITTTWYANAAVDTSKYLTSTSTRSKMTYSNTTALPFRSTT